MTVLLSSLTRGSTSAFSIFVGTLFATLVFQIVVIVAGVVVYNFFDMTFTGPDRSGSSYSRSTIASVKIDAMTTLNESEWLHTDLIRIKLGWPFRCVALSGVREVGKQFSDGNLPPGPVYREENYILSYCQDIDFNVLSVMANLVLGYLALIGVFSSFCTLLWVCRVRRGRCGCCGYIIENQFVTCPECGAACRRMQNWSG